MPNKGYIAFSLPSPYPGGWDEVWKLLLAGCALFDLSINFPNHPVLAGGPIRAESQLVGVTATDEDSKG
jgi:hypothetical protein